MAEKLEKIICIAIELLIASLWDKGWNIFYRSGYLKKCVIIKFFIRQLY
jgi:hypothetical protein